MKNILLPIILLSVINCANNKQSVPTKTDTQKIISTNQKKPKIIYSEMYGSVCCPKDALHTISLTKAVKTYNASHTKNPIQLYKIIRGREGEGLLLVSAKNCNDPAVQKFIEERIQTVQKNGFKIDGEKIKKYDTPMDISTIFKTMNIIDTDYSKYLISQ